MPDSPSNLLFTASGAVTGSFNTLISSLARLASGRRINTAADDPAGLAVSDLIRGDIATARQGARNASDGISMLQTAEGAAGSINRNLVRMKELATQAASPTYSMAQKKIMQREFDQLTAENARIAAQTTFNGVHLLTDGRIEIAAGDSSITLTTQSLATPSADLIANPLDAARAIDASISAASTYRASLGSAMQRLESASEVLSVRAENLLTSSSRISDVDYAIETARMTGRKIQTIAAASFQVHAGAIAHIMQLLIG
jgi:flagellin